MIRLPVIPRSLRWVVVAGVVALVVAFSVVPLPRSATEFGPLGLFPIRTYLHAIAYAGFAVVLGYALVDSPRPTWQVLIIVLVTTIGFGLAMELLQLGLPHRKASLADVALNLVGAALAVVGWRLLLPRARLEPVSPPGFGG